MGLVKTYLVGGAVRDSLLGKPVKDRDFVVVGSNQLELLKLGYEQVGMGFPVFLHPETGEEYALARKEKKVGAGYTGFEFQVDEHVTLVEDLERRDLTINSMAMDDDGSLIDPFGGERDLADKVLRHTSAAFGEDPLRVVRLARFYARYDGFRVADETMTLASQMVERGDLDELPAERFWLEVTKALSDHSPQKFFELLFEIGALNDVEFFKTMFGGNVNGTWLKSIMRLSQEVRALEEPLRTDVFAAVVAPMSVQNWFNTARAGNLYNALKETLMISTNPTAFEVQNLLTKCRGWGTSSIADDLVSALWVKEWALGGQSNTISAWMLAKCLEVGRTVTSEPYQHLEGKAIGAAMAAERVEKIRSVLSS